QAAVLGVWLGVGNGIVLGAAAFWAFLLRILLQRTARRLGLREHGCEVDVRYDFVSAKGCLGLAESKGRHRGTEQPLEIEPLPEIVVGPRVVLFIAAAVDGRVERSGGRDERRNQICEWGRFKSRSGLG